MASSIRRIIGTTSPVVKGDKFGTFQSPRNQLETNQIRMTPYALVVGSIVYAQVCTHLLFGIHYRDAW